MSSLLKNVKTLCVLGRTKRKVWINTCFKVKKNKNIISLTNCLKHPPHTVTHTVTPSQTQPATGQTAGRPLLLEILKNTHTHTHRHTHTKSNTPSLFSWCIRQGDRDREKRKIRKIQITLLSELRSLVYWCLYTNPSSQYFGSSNSNLSERDFGYSKQCSFKEYCWKTG